MNFMELGEGGTLPPGVTVTINENGIGVDGSAAMTVEAQYAAVPDALKVRLLMKAVGDGAAHAGTLEAVFTLTLPDKVPSDETTVDRQIEDASNYATSMISAMGEFITGDRLGTLFNEAAEAASDEVKMTTQVVKAIAGLLVLKAGGDKVRAKALMPETLEEFARSEDNITDLVPGSEQWDRVVAMMALAIDRVDV